MTISQAHAKSSLLTSILGFQLNGELKLVITLGKRVGEHAKAKFWHRLNPDVALTFPTYSLYNHILESP